MSAPLIAVTGSLIDAKDGRPARVTVNAAYLRAIEQAGGVPVVVAPGASAAATIRLIERCEGLMLTGGGDIDPKRYGEDAHPATTGVSPARDRSELATIAIALDRDMPILAICRGMQILNVALGGTLVQDLPGPRPLDVDHRQDAARDDEAHEVRVEPGSTLAMVLGGVCIETNSMHHQGLATLGEGIRAVAWTKDGLVEGVELPGHHWVLGVQWHPEELTAGYEHARRLFAAFIEAAEGMRLRSSPGDSRRLDGLADRPSRSQS